MLMAKIPRRRSNDPDGKCDLIDTDVNDDDFILLSPEEVALLNSDPECPFKVPPGVREVYVNRNKASPRVARWVFESGNVGRVFSREYRECRDGARHEVVRELVESYDDLLDRYENCASKDGEEGQVCGIIYVLARTGQRIGSREDAASEQYRYEKTPKGRPRRVITGRASTYGISTLRARHVRLEGDVVLLDFPGKGGQPQSQRINNPVIADLFRRLLLGKEPDDPVFSPHIYRSVYVKFKNDTGHAVKDLRTAMAHLIVPAAKRVD
jgi:Eukaryotic DNA topoisomerase I, catalytic core.